MEVVEGIERELFFGDVKGIGRGEYRQNELAAQRERGLTVSVREVFDPFAQCHRLPRDRDSVSQKPLRL
jgi:hypothetical protein